MTVFSYRGWGQTVITANNPNSGNYEITTNTTWSDPIYHIKDDIDITDGATLTISGGVQLIFFDDLSNQLNPPTSGDLGVLNQTGIFILNKEGSLIVNGTQNQLVTFTANSISLGWEGIIFDDVIKNPYSEINYSIIEYVKKTLPACGPSIVADGAIFINDFNNITIQNCIIRNNTISKRGGGIFVAMEAGLSVGSPNGQINILSNHIYNNTAKKGGGICLFTGGNPLGDQTIRPFALINGNQINNNTAEHSGGGICLLKESDAIIEGNNIYQNIANCATTASIPTFQGGGGISISFLSEALIEDNIIEYNEADFYSNANSSVNTGVGGGILICIKSEASIIKNQISTNYAYFGGGIAVVNGSGNTTQNANGVGPSSVNLANNYIRTNEAYHGGGIYISHSHGNMEWNDINDNTAINGGGLFLYSTTDSYGNSTDKVVLNNSIIRYNNAIRGAGIWVDGEMLSSPLINKFEIYNNLIINNTTTSFAAANYFGNNLNLSYHNNTVSNNYTSFSSDGDGIYVEPNSNNNTLSFINNILYFNGLTWTECQINQYPFTPNEYSFNNIMYLGCAIDPTNNFDLPPEFVNVSNFNYRLLPNSPLIDLGDDNVNPVSTFDLDGNLRFNNHIDIGAYEFYHPPIRKSKDVVKGYNVYPNPFLKTIKIDLSSNSSNVMIEVFSIDGKILYSKNFEQASSLLIDMSSFESGIYLINIITDYNSYQEKIIKQ